MCTLRRIADLDPYVWGRIYFEELKCTLHGKDLMFTNKDCQKLHSVSTINKRVLPIPESSSDRLYSERLVEIYAGNSIIEIANKYEVWD